MRTIRLLTASFICLLSIPFAAAQEYKPAEYSVTSDSWVPYWIIDNSNISGLLSDIMKEIDHRIPNKLTPIDPIPLKRAKYGFKAGDIELECCVNTAWRKAEDQLAVTLWTDTVMNAEEILIFPKGRAFPFEKLSDLTGKHLTTILGYGYVGDQYFTRNDVYKNTSLIKMVAAGRGDGAIIDRYEYLYATKHNKELEGLSAKIDTGPVINRSELKMRIHNSRPDLLPLINKAVAEMKADGTIETIFSSYTGSIEN